jgi:hypothetical protein
MEARGRVHVLKGRGGTLQLAAVGDDNLLAGLARLGAEALNLLDNVHAWGGGEEEEGGCPCGPHIFLYF